MVNLIKNPFSYTKDEFDDDGESSAKRDLNVVGTEMSSSSEDESESEQIAAEDDAQSENEHELNHENVAQPQKDSVASSAKNWKVENRSEEKTEEKTSETTEPMNIVEEKSENVASNATAPAASRKPAVYIHVDRTAEVQAARLKLPILGEEQIIMETINENNIVILVRLILSSHRLKKLQF